jgi:hypothetical protein
MGSKKRIRVRGVRKERPDIRKLSRAIIQLAQAQAEAEAAAEHTKQSREDKDSAERTGDSS